jgi:hypothetical protein
MSVVFIIFQKAVKMNGYVQAMGGKRKKTVLLKNVNMCVAKEVMNELNVSL